MVPRNRCFICIKTDHDLPDVKRLAEAAPEAPEHAHCTGGALRQTVLLHMTLEPFLSLLF